MNAFILWTHSHRDLIIFAAIVLSSFAGYWTHADITKAKLKKLEILKTPHLVKWQGRTGTIYCYEDDEVYPCPTLLLLEEVMK